MKRQIAKGISLIELTISASLLGILFFSGLQFLTTLFTVQSHLSGPNPSLSVSNALLETKLYILLAAAQAPAITQKDQILTFNLNERPEKLIFSKTQNQWELRLQDQIIGQWPRANNEIEPYFALANEHLIKVQPPLHQAPLLVWLRNDE